MANQLATKKEKSQKHRSIQEIMRDPVMKAKLTNLVDEAVVCRSKIEYEKQNIKALREVAADEIGLKPSLFNNFVAATFNNDYMQRKDGLEQQLTLIELIMDDATQSLPSGNDD